MCAGFVLAAAVRRHVLRVPAGAAAAALLEGGRPVGGILQIDSGLGQFISAAAPNIQVAQILSPVLIILLMLSQDGGFVSTAHAVMLPTVPWFKERLLHVLAGKLGVRFPHVYRTTKTPHNLASHRY